MKCWHPDCTSKHDHSGRHYPYTEVCPEARRKHAEAQWRYSGTGKGMATDARSRMKGRA